MTLRATAMALIACGSAIVLVGCKMGDGATAPETVSHLAVRDIQTSTCSNLQPVDVNRFALIEDDRDTTQTDVSSVNPACDP